MSEKKRDFQRGVKRGGVRKRKTRPWGGEESNCRKTPKKWDRRGGPPGSGYSEKRDR